VKLKVKKVILKGSSNKLFISSLKLSSRLLLVVEALYLEDFVCCVCDAAECGAGLLVQLFGEEVKTRYKFGGKNIT
jgi:hypothetical protein